MAAVDEHRQSNSSRPPEVDQSVHRAADRATRIQDVVDQYDRGSVQVERQVGALDDGLLGDERKVVAIEGDVERSDREADPFVLLDRLRHPSRKRDAAALDADYGEALRAGLLLYDLMGNSNDGSPNLVPGHYLPVGHRSSLPCTTQSSFPASRCRSLKVVGRIQRRQNGRPTDGWRRPRKRCGSAGEGEAVSCPVRRLRAQVPPKIRSRRAPGRRRWVRRSRPKRAG